MDEPVYETGFWQPPSKNGHAIRLCTEPSQGDRPL